MNISFFKQEKNVLGLFFLIEDFQNQTQVLKKGMKLHIRWSAGPLFPMRVGLVYSGLKKIGVLPYETALKVHYLQQNGQNPELIVAQVYPQELQKIQIEIWSKPIQNTFVRPGAMSTRSVQA
jgi:hypothetical protein